MAVPRPVLLALVGLALCAAAFLSTRGAKDPGGAVTALPATAPTPAPASTAKRPATQHQAAPPKHQAPARTAQKPAAKAAPKAAAGPSRKSLATAAEVTSALGRGNAVVFFFTRTGAADDAGTAAAVKSLNGVRHVVVVHAGLDDLTEFRPVLTGAGVSQVPAVVVAHAGKPARLIQGYVDPGTLRQTVADSLR
jgi:hypothetical protein